MHIKMNIVNSLTLCNSYIIMLLLSIIAILLLIITIMIFIFGIYIFMNDNSVCNQLNTISSYISNCSYCLKGNLDKFIKKVIEKLINILCGDDSPSENKCN
jgi:hypothetical protein